MPAFRDRLMMLSATTLVLAATSTSAIAQKKYDTGATDTEIKIGNIMPYGGSASAYGVIGKTEAAYFKKINAEGGINGRKSISSHMMTATARRRRLNKPANWSKATKCCSYSILSVRRPIRQFKSI